MNKIDELSKAKKQLTELRKNNRLLKLELDVLDKIGKALSSIFNLDDLLHMVMTKITEIMEADRSTLFILDKEDNVLWSKIAQGTLEIRVPVGKGIAGHVAETGEVINIPDAYKDPRFNKEVDKKTGYRTKTILTIPMRNKYKEITGVIQVLNKKKGVFKKIDEDLCAVLGTQISLAIENVRLYEYYLSKKETEHEMKIANETQKNLLPKTCPYIENYDICGFNTPAKDTGGDYYDFINLDENKWAIAIGDITGKGMPAALLMTTARAYIQALSSPTEQINKVIGKLNQAMCADTAEDKFLTLFYGVLDPKSNKFTYTNAGHDAPYWLRNNKINMLVTGNILVGSFPGIPYAEKSITLKSGDVIVLYTDGIVEATNTKNELYGEDRFINLIKKNKKHSSKDLIDKIFSDVKKFAGKCPQHDDITMIVIKAL